MVPDFRTNDLDDLASPDPRIKYGRVKSILAIAKRDPKPLYPHLSAFARLLGSDNSILTWMAIDVLGAMAPVDEEKRIGRLLPRILAFLDSGRLISVAHAVSACAAIAKTRPEYRDRMTRALLTVPDRVYETAECRNIAIGKAILALESYAIPDALEPDVLAFVRRHADNSRPATRKKAEKFLARGAKCNDAPRKR